MADGRWQMAGGRPHAVLLDCLGTLLRLEPPAPLLRRALSRRGLEVGQGAAERAVDAEIRYYLDHHLEGRDERTLADLRDRCARVVGESLGVGREWLAPVREALREALRFEPYADVGPALRVLRSRGLGVVVASNWDCSLPATLAAAGLAPLLDGVVTSAGVGAAKPDPRPLLAALELVDCAPEAAVCVGDSRRTDVAAARAARIEPLLLVRDEGGRPAGDEPSARREGVTGGELRTVRTLDEAASLVLGGR